MPFSSDQLALQAHIDAENERWNEQCRANGSTWWTTTVSDPAHWEEYGITTVAQYQRYCLESTLWDVYKEAHGFRPRHMGIEDMSDDEIQREIDSCMRWMEQEAERLAEWEEQQRYNREGEIQRFMDLGAPDRETAERWVKQSREG